MKIVDRLEDTLNGGYGGLYGEVVTEDTYGLRKVVGGIGLVLDIGANVGTFTRFARELFSNAFIVAVEPDPENFIHLQKFTNTYGIKFLNNALGHGRMWKQMNAPNGAHESYLPVGMGYNDSEYETTGISALMLDDIMRFVPEFPAGKT